MPSTLVLVTYTDPTHGELCLVVEGGTWHPGKAKYTKKEYDDLLAAGTIDSRSHFKPTTADPSLVRILVPHTPPKWGFVKGEYADRYHAGETSQEGIKRELMEETGLVLSLDRFVKTGKIGKTADKNHVYEVNITHAEKNDIEGTLKKRIADHTGEVLGYDFVPMATVCSTPNLNNQSKQACDIIKKKLSAQSKKSRSKSHSKSRSHSHSPASSKTRRNRRN